MHRDTEIELCNALREIQLLLHSILEELKKKQNQKGTARSRSR